MTRGEITVHMDTPIPESEYEFRGELLRHEKVKAGCVDKILKDDPKFAEWFTRKTK